MTETLSRTRGSLGLDDPVLGPGSARRVGARPPAQDDGRVTVIMTPADDTMARNTVTNALGRDPSLVQRHSAKLDALLAENVAEGDCRPLHLRVCAWPRPVPDQVLDYARALGDLLGAHVDVLATRGAMEALTDEAMGAACDLVIFKEPRFRLFHSLLSHAVTDGGPILRPSGIPFGVLTARRPRWPLKSILLVVSGEGPDDAAVDWVLRLARHGRIAVTILAIVPPVPAMYGQRGRMDQGLPALLSTETVLGQRMRQVARRLVDCEIEGTLRLRQGPLEWQIQCEIAQEDYDLIALAANPRQWWMRWLDGDLIGSLLRRVDLPVLVAKPTTA